MENSGDLWLGRNAWRSFVAAALSIPVVISEGHPFPIANLILFITFIVILVTLVVQGLTLPMADPENTSYEQVRNDNDEEQEIIIQKKMAHASLQYLEEKYTEDLSANEHISNLHSRMKLDVAFFNRGFEENKELQWKLAHPISTHLP